MLTEKETLRFSSIIFARPFKQICDFGAKVVDNLMNTFRNHLPVKVLYPTA